MTLKTLESIRKTELIAYLTVLSASLIISNQSETEELKQIINYLSENKIDLETIRKIILNICTLDCIFSAKTEQLTKEHRRLKMLYDEIIYNTASLYKEIGLNEPVSIFATYVYMYRKGYFSHNKQFLYGKDSKDFAMIGGLDVIIGTGVCRHISSLLSDIYRKMGMQSYNIPVQVKPNSLDNMTELNTEKLLEEENTSSEFIEKAGEVLSKIIPLANHQITIVEDAGINYIFDPTNDGFLQNKNTHYLKIASDTSSLVRNCMFGIEGIYSNLIGQTPDGINLIKKYHQVNLPTVSYKEYERRYLETLKLCINNEIIFQEFFQKNEKTIDKVYNIGKIQNGLIKRLIL